jgi:hypothetical protein
MRTRERGNVMEYYLAVAIALVLWLFFAVQVFLKLGFHLKSVGIAASPPVLLGVFLLVSRGRELFAERLAASRVERILRSLEGGEVEAARREWLALPDKPEARWAIEARRARVVAAVEAPWPGREIAYRLHLRLNDRYQDVLARPLQDALALWPEDLFPPVLADIARNADPDEATRAVLERTSPEARRAVLGKLFGIINPVAPKTPTEKWLGLLRPYRALLEELVRDAHYPASPKEHARLYLARMDGGTESTD